MGTDLGTIGDYFGDYSPGFAPDCAILCAEKVRYCLILWRCARLHKRVLSNSDSEGRRFESCRVHQQSRHPARQADGFFALSPHHMGMAMRSTNTPSAASKLHTPLCRCTIA